MAIRVSPTEAQPTHHISLTDGTDTLGLVLCDGKGVKDARGIKQSGYPRSVTRISQGVSGYSDFELPYSPQVQSDFSGGRGSEDLEKDTTRYLDSYRADTTRGDIICGPKATQTTWGTQALDTTSGATADALTHNLDVATKFVLTSAMTVRQVDLQLTSVQNIIGADVYIMADSAGAPGSTLASNVNGFSFIETASAMTLSAYFNSVALAAGTYWLAWMVSGTAEYTFKTSAKAGYNLMWWDLGPWELLESNRVLAYRISPVSHGKAHFFEYRGSLFTASAGDDKTAPRLLLNGFHGMADSNSTNLTFLNDSGGGWTTDALIGKVVKVVAGPGSEEAQPWRIITDNTATVLTVNPPWKVAHTTATEYAILGCNTWQEITGHGMTTAITDVMVVDDMVFFAQGEAVTIVRGRYAAGSWAWYFDGTNASTGNKATFLKYITDTQGKMRVWRALALASSVSYAPKPTWAASNSTTLVFKTDVICGTTDSKITGIEEYGTPLTLYVMKEDGFGSIGGTTDALVGVYAMHPLSSQIKNVRSENNGRAHMRYDLFLKFSMLDGLASHFDQRVDDVGPNRDEGLPNDTINQIDRRGHITALVPYAGKFYASVSAEADPYSSQHRYACVLCCTRDGSWHEIYRSALDTGIENLYIQVIPGKTADRLWISEEENLYWVPIAIDPRKQEDYTYFSGAYVDTAWIYSGFKDVQKYFHELTVFAENLSATEYIAAYYRVDNETEWTRILTTNFVTSPSQTARLTNSNNVSGRRIQLRFVLVTNNELISPRIKAFRLDGVIRLKPKKMWNVTYMVKDNQLDLQGQEQSGLTIAGVAASWTPESVMTLLDKWADSDQTPDPITLRTLRTLHDNKLTFIEPTSITPLSQVTTPNREIVLVGSFTLLEA